MTATQSSLSDLISSSYGISPALFGIVAAALTTALFVTIWWLDTKDQEKKEALPFTLMAKTSIGAFIFIMLIGSWSIKQQANLASELILDTRTEIRITEVRGKRTMTLSRPLVTRESEILVLGKPVVETIVEKPAKFTEINNSQLEALMGSGLILAGGFTLSELITKNN